MKQNIYLKFLTIIFAVICAIAILIAFEIKFIKERLPEFSNYENILKRKTEFITFIAPKIRQANYAVALERQKILTIHHKKTFNELEAVWVNSLAKKYNIKTFNITKEKSWDELKARVDIIPLSMALAQAALESGWGTSRFSKEGKNFFGVWCYNKGCGIVPQKRDLNKNHEIKSYYKVEDGVRHYIHNLNTHKAYAEFRAKRYNLRKAKHPLSGYLLVGLLKNYSITGQTYIKTIRSMIKSNNLE